MTYTTEQERVDTTVFKQLLNDYADCLRNGDFQDAGAALLAVVAEYQQAARRAPAEPVGAVPDVSALVEALERVKLTDDEVRHHALHGSAYWDNAVTACICAVINAHRKQGGGQ